MPWRHDQASALPSNDQDDSCEHYREARAQAESLRLDLADARARIERLEAELWAITLRSCSLPHDQQFPANATELIVRTRTATRKVLFDQIAEDAERAGAVRDLRMAEVAFDFLLRLRYLRDRAG
jgi:hypothetical protein